MSLVHTMTGGFNTLLLPNLQLWLDASDSSTITITSGAVSNWANKAPTGSSFDPSQSTSGQRPTYATAISASGLNAVLFDGIDDNMANTGDNLLHGVAGWTLFLVNRPTQNTATAAEVYIGAGGVAARVQTLVNSSGFDLAGGRRNDADIAANITNSSVVSTSVFRLWSVVADFNATTITMYNNGSQTAQSTSWLTSGITPNDEGKLSLGLTLSGSAPFKGYKGEIILCGSALSTSFRTAAESLLTTKWGL